jgi:hypothetical protein
VVRVRDLGARARLEVGRSELERARALGGRDRRGALRRPASTAIALETYVTPLERSGCAWPWISTVLRCRFQRRCGTAA